MAATTLSRSDFSRAFVIARREIRDSFRDWRIIAPILALTLFFPALMNFTARQAVEFVTDYGAPVIGERLIPFLLMIVGFFPISVSLVIALESFVGEKERHSLEPLLSSPLSDVQLYVGKTLAATVPPLLAAYLGIIVYLTVLYLSLRWTPPPISRLPKAPHLFGTPRRRRPASDWDASTCASPTRATRPSSSSTP